MNAFSQMSSAASFGQLGTRDYVLDDLRVKNKALQTTLDPIDSFFKCNVIGVVELNIDLYGDDSVLRIFIAEGGFGKLSMTLLLRVPKGSGLGGSCSVQQAFFL